MVCTITSSQKTAKYEGIKSITLPAFSGEMQIMSRHAEAFIELKQGNILLKNVEGHVETVSISGGECYVKNDSVTVIL